MNVGEIKIDFKGITVLKTLEQVMYISFQTQTTATHPTTVILTARTAYLELYLIFVFNCKITVTVIPHTPFHPCSQGFKINRK